jgi:hypothetical protein
MKPKEKEFIKKFNNQKYEIMDFDPYFKKYMIVRAKIRNGERCITEEIIAFGLN